MSFKVSTWRESFIIIINHWSINKISRRATDPKQWKWASRSSFRNRLQRYFPFCLRWKIGTTNLYPQKLANTREFHVKIGMGSRCWFFIRGWLIFALDLRIVLFKQRRDIIRILIHCVWQKSKMLYLSSMLWSSYIQRWALLDHYAALKIAVKIPKKGRKIVNSWANQRQRLQSYERQVEKSKVSQMLGENLIKKSRKRNSIKIWHQSVKRKIFCLSNPFTIKSESAIWK